MTSIVPLICNGVVLISFALVGVLSGCGGMESSMQDSSITNADEARVAKMAADWRWKHRLLVVAAESPGTALDLQWSSVAEVKAEWLDRALLLVMLANSEGWVVRDPSAARSVSHHLTAGETAAFRDRYKLSREKFEAVLVGKDGGVKSRYSQVVDPATIFPFIDSMPMRMDEIKAASE